MSEKPNLDQVTEVLRRADNAFGWIGEGDEIVRDLLAWIDGENDDIAVWAMSLCEHCGKYQGDGPVDGPRHTTWCKTQS